MTISKNKLNGVGRVLVAILRHTAVSDGLTVHPGGWVSVAQVMSKLPSITKEDIFEVVRTESKQRLALNEDKTLIRANQGHSFEVDLQLEPMEPPSVLLHGTKPHALNSILQEGLTKQSRHAVHLTAQDDVAKQVGGRKISEAPIVLVVHALDMHKAGYVFYKTANEVWLTDHVPPQYIEHPAA